ncbi:MAG: hypothetical protein PHY95_02965, partial [Candidatus ainarchaeum sp.]|nr:hypothetical protein [Candidatus ainarchaeum sp.]
NYTAYDLRLDSCWYELDGSSSVPLPGCLNSTTSLANGGHYLELFANDTAGNVNSSNVTFSVHVPSSAPPAASDGDMDVEWERECPGNLIVISASDGGEPLEGVDVRLVLREPNAGEIASGSTGADGSILFNASMNGTYNAYLELSSYTYGNPLVFAYTTCPAGLLPEIAGCNVSADCAAGEVCTAGVCVSGLQEQPTEGEGQPQEPAQPPATHEDEAPGTPSQPGCITNADCGPGFTCASDGSCVRVPETPAGGANESSSPAAGEGGTGPLVAAELPGWAPPLGVVAVVLLAYVAHRMWLTRKKGKAE